MKINPQGTVVLFKVMVDPTQRGGVDDIDIANPEKYNYFVIDVYPSAEQGDNY
jgi:hypothetical protein